MDALPHLLNGGRCVLLLAPGVMAPSLLSIETRHVGLQRLPHHVWEQTALPWAARDGVLLSLAGGAPWYSNRQVLLLHDAAVFDHPEAYTRPFVWWYRLLFRRLTQHARQIWTVSDFSRARLAWHLGLDINAIGQLSPGSEHLQAVVAKSEVLAQLGLSPGDFLLAVASENPTKNMAALLKAFAQMPNENSRRLVIVGGRNARVFAPIVGHSDPTGVIRAGPIGDGELKALYENATALVIPSFYEGFGLPAAEAMACHCPVVAARAASLPEVCGDAALYFDPTSTEDIVRALHRVQGDSALRTDLVSAGARRAHHFRWEQSARRLLSGLTSVTNA